MKISDFGLSEIQLFILHRMCKFSESMPISALIFAELLIMDSELVKYAPMDDEQIDAVLSYCMDNYTSKRHGESWRRYVNDNILKKRREIFVKNVFPFAVKPLVTSGFLTVKHSKSAISTQYGLGPMSDFYRDEMNL